MTPKLQNPNAQSRAKQDQARTRALRHATWLGFWACAVSSCFACATEGPRTADTTGNEVVLDGSQGAAHAREGSVHLRPAYCPVMGANNETGSDSTLQCSDTAHTSCGGPSRDGQHRL